MTLVKAVPDDSLIRGLLARLAEEKPSQAETGASAQFFAKQGRLRVV